MRPCIFPKENYNVLSPDFPIYVSVSDLYIPRIGLPILLPPNRQTDPRNIEIAQRYMNVGIGTRQRSFISENTKFFKNIPCIDLETLINVTPKHLPKG